jgi:glutamate--cysteine ligase catalytic subunit
MHAAVPRAPTSPPRVSRGRYMPLSLVDENMRRAHGRDAATNTTFFFRVLEGPREGEVEEMSVAQILGGKEGAFPGLVPLIFAYLDEIEIDPETLALVSNYMELLLRRARGELLTPAAWMRAFIHEHPDYRHDSLVPESTAHDLMQACAAIGEGRRQEPSLLGKRHIQPLRTDNAWPTPLTAPRLSRDVLAKYRMRRDAAHKDKA